jgi:phosphoinositide-3-kinase regulatory subunit 4
MLRLRTQILSPDARIALVATNYGELLNTTAGVDDAWGKEYFSRVIGPTLLRYEKSSTVTPNQTKTQPTKPNEEKKETDLSDLSMEELLLETEELLRMLDSGFYTNADDLPVSTETIKPVAMFDHFPKLPSRADGISQPLQSAIIILLQIVFSSVGHVQRASSKFVALKLMHRIALFSSDDIRLQRIIPFVTSLLNDSEPIVRASGISVLASVLSGKSYYLKHSSPTQNY